MLARSAERRAASKKNKARSKAPAIPPEAMEE
jgi:hypothetical protein